MAEVYGIALAVYFVGAVMGWWVRGQWDTREYDIVIERRHRTQRDSEGVG